MKLIPGLLVTALAVPLTFAQDQSPAQAGAQQRNERPTAAEQSGSTTDQDHRTPTATQPQTDTSATRSRTAETTESRVSPNDRKFMTEAAEGGMAEVQLAQLAQEKASSEEVKALARMIGDDHQKANEKLKEIAAHRNVELPADVGPKHKQVMTRLQALEGAAFDKAYTDAMVKDHKAELKKFQKQAKNGLDTDLREFAENTVPTLEKHLQEAQQRQSSMRSRSR
jgi:putative membrane protein